uniref:Uncharacterized protein n=1 Tax=Myoviridae sp. ctRD66 TaxID=2823544 RepID=A0A8S5LGG0_9CAUD|nr:MAG TPA: hypothetical protein [Myoviridae sp. ctRD66]DAR68629.1 MAG TPA: hypothetical protein [Caudoviricetes sp.]DAS67080.1 MAG TPA: hypothetical protein [Caudoviricetes sp.]
MQHQNSFFQNSNLEGSVEDAPLFSFSQLHYSEILD